ncbi:MAG: phosphodiester glycosidase family protein [Flavobacteriales bacterium]|nr:phosphodiester glycosidase family protein [Flavobacteriales bacterium]MCB9447979.1 phosphodiester glycosidase family protein [Flavobacteriales bacterium]
MKKLITLGALILGGHAIAQTPEAKVVPIQDNAIVSYYNFIQNHSGDTGDSVPSDIQQGFENAVHSAQLETGNLIGECTFRFNGLQYDAIVADPKRQRIRMHLQMKHLKRPYRDINSLKTELEEEHTSILMITNGGMYLEGNKPQGLLIADDTICRPLDTISSGYGNFYLQPNGVFFVDDDGAGISTTGAFSKRFVPENKQVHFATQSGPMLVIDGKIHPKFVHGSKNLHLRSGVGIMPDGKVVFIISRSNKTNFHDFAVIFKDVFGCANALYLDGAISKMYLPHLRPDETGGNFGTMISVTE